MREIYDAVRISSSGLSSDFHCAQSAVIVVDEVHRVSEPMGVCFYHVSYQCYWINVYTLIVIYQEYGLVTRRLHIVEEDGILVY